VLHIFSADTDMSGSVYELLHRWNICFENGEGQCAGQ